MVVFLSFPFSLAVPPFSFFQNGSRYGDHAESLLEFPEKS